MRCWIALKTCITIDCTASAPSQAQPCLLLDEAEVQRSVARIALGFTPRVALADEAVLFDATASLRLFGGLPRLMQLLEQRIQAFFQSNRALAQVKRAQGATSLIALGRLRLQYLLPDGAAPARVADLPLQTLSAARPHFAVLERIGCRTWDDLLRLPREGVARRFGAELLAALDQARGSAPDEYDWLVLPEHFEEKIELSALVIHAPALMMGVEQLLARLHIWLLGRQSGLCALKIIWHLDKRRDTPPTGELEIRTAEPAQDLRHMSRLIAEHLARQKLPAPVHSLSLLSMATERLTDSAAATGSLLMQAHQQGDGIAQLIERLSARLGDDNVQAWQPAADHRPEQMQRWVNARCAIESIAGSADKTRARSTKRLKNGSTDDSQSPKSEALYPTWLLPLPLKLATVGNSPVYQGKLVRLAGPQRLEAAEWLQAGPPSQTSQASETSRTAQTAMTPNGCDKPLVLRDYFIYRSQQGSLLWIYSERLAPSRQAGQHAVQPQQQQRAWYLHGFFA